MNYKNMIIEMFLRETWEEPLAKGYKHGQDRKGAAKDLDNSKEEVPGETEFPTYDDFKKAKRDMNSHNKRFTQTYDEWKNHKNGTK